MKKSIMTIVLIALVSPLLITAWAQQRGGKGMKKQMYSREYNLETIETIEGKVVEVTNNPSQMKGGQMGVHMMVATASDTVPVHLGPVWYLEQQEEIKKGDQISVTGSRIMYNGSPALIAATVKRDQMTLRLRDQNGYPAWRGWRMGNPQN